VSRQPRSRRRKMLPGLRRWSGCAWSPPSSARAACCNSHPATTSAWGEGPSWRAATFAPEEFEAPAGFEAPDFRVRMLAISDVVEDYGAVMTSVERNRCEHTSPGLSAGV
jgi:hypothetical protein